MTGFEGHTRLILETVRESELGYDGTVIMRVVALTVDPFTTLPVVLLRDESGEHAAGIGVGLTEAAAIATELDGIELERPMTHQLMGDMLGKAGVSVERVVVSASIDEHQPAIRATIYLTLPCGGVATQDARPSDAFALALRVGAEIRVARSVLDSLASASSRTSSRPSAHPMASDSACATMLLADESADLLEGLADQSFGKWKN